MRKIIIGLLTVSSINAFACPDISGKYICPKEADQPTALGTRTIQLKKSPFADIYSMKLANDSLMFEVDVWNYGIDPNTGDMDRSTETMAECKGDTVILNVKETVRADGINVTVSGSFDVTKTSSGINLSLKTEGEELHNFNCTKQ